jgi:DNA-binding CsgD family transcriptional regulator
LLNVRATDRDISAVNSVINDMRVILVAPPARLRRLRAALPDGFDVVGEASTMSAARLLDGNPDAFLVATAKPTDGEPLIETLTARETEVLNLLADGLSNKAIASKLGVSDETVKFHLTSIFGKLGASNRTDAVRQALRRGLVPL